MLPNSAAAYELYLGLLAAGVVPIPLEPTLRRDELAAFLDDCAASLLFLDKTPPGRAPAGGWRPLADLPHGILALARRRPAARRASTGEPPALIWPTSGSTGVPKGVVISHRAALARWKAIEPWMGPPGTRYLCVLPLAFSLPTQCLGCFAVGGTLVLAREFGLKTLASFWDIVRARRPDLIFLVPAIVEQLLAFRTGTRAAARSLRYAISVSAPLRPELIERFERRFDVPLLNGYGLKEVGILSLTPPVLSERAIDAVGRPIGGRVRLAPDGEILFRGPTLFSGYARGRELERSALRGGWLRTGDSGHLDARGRLHVTGRLKSLVIRAGLKINPEELDRALRRHKDVVDAATRGYSDRTLGDRLLSLIVRRPNSRLSEADLIAFCRARLASHKCPDRIEFVDRIERTSIGKPKML
jgi:acyl-CoA synthetase (AMP-forming)/AMP-acid ligase II